MSAYYVGPFGRMLPTTDGLSAEPEPERSANLPAPGIHPYQLPPPRSSAPLQFGSDPFLPQHNQAERSDSGISLHPKDSNLPRYRSEQLPSVSQLLKPVSRSSPPSPYHPQAFSKSPSASENREASLSFNHPDHDFAPRMPQAAVHDCQSDRLLQQHSGNLPPISHVTAQGPGGDEARAYPAPRADSPAPPFQQGQTSYRGTVYHEKGLRSRVSVSESPGRGTVTPDRSKKPQVRPHVVDERYIEGEGLCYIYADGSHCPKAIDGIPVNANWGVTKAGRPRKRLAQACLTCREKKIKCQPNLPKCDQCQKSGRECRFESAHRGNRAAPKASQHATKSGGSDAKENLSSSGFNSTGSSSLLYSIVRASESSTSLPGTSGQSPVSEGSMLTPAAADSVQDPVTDFEQPYQTRSKSSVGVDDRPKRSSESIETQTSADYSEILMEFKDIDPGDPLANDWNTDPYDTDPELTMHLVECYLSYVNDSLFHMFPRRRFILWLKSCRTKSRDDKMLLYVMMTMGSVFSDRPDRLMALRRCSRTARYAVEHSQHSLSLQLAQSRIIMSLWYYAIGAVVKSWDSIGAAVRTVCGLRYNIESDGVIVDQSRICEYGLHPQALMECRRRTFWVAFMMDRLSSYYSPSSIFIPSQTAFLRLPCREDVYEAQQYATVPYFQSFLNQVPLAAGEHLSALSAMAFLIEIVALWGDVSHHVVRSPHIPAKAYGKLSEEFRTTTIQRSEGWMNSLPNHLTFTMDNMEKSICAGKADAFISIHMLYHATLMKLHRYTRYQHLSSGTVNQYIHRARHHAVEILRTTLALARYAAERDASRSAAEPVSLRWTFLNPWLGCMILSAVDVLSAVGLMTDLPECVTLIRAGLETVRELGRIWASSMNVVSLIEMRMESMVKCLQDRSRLEGKLVFAVDGLPLDSRVRVGALQHNPTGPINEDLLYGGLPRERLFIALGIDEISLSEERICWIKESE